MNYVANMPHDGWRQFLPYLISQYKTGGASISQEGLTAWYRRNPRGFCDARGTTGNDADHGQQVLDPEAVSQDKVFYSALLSSHADVSVSIGGQEIPAGWRNTPSSGQGIYHGNVDRNGRTGKVIVQIKRNGKAIKEVSNGPDINGNCDNSSRNFNAWVGSDGGSATGGNGGSGNGGNGNSGNGGNTGNSGLGSDGSKNGVLCNAGTGVDNLSGLCGYACRKGYCPPPACTCTSWGTPEKEDPITGQAGYPLPGLGCGYVGLCSYAFNHGYYPDKACGTNPAGAAGC